MRHCLPTALLMLTMVCGLATAADPPAKPTPATYDKPQSTGSYANPLPANQIATPPTVANAIIKTNKANVAKTPKVDNPGYTQLGGIITVKLDRPKTQLSLYENSTYAIVAERKNVVIATPPNLRLIKIEDADINGISFHTLEPGVVTLTFVEVEVDEETNEENVGKQYIVEITILGDTRQLQLQLEKLYPQASIQAIKVRDSVLLRGTVAKLENIKEIVEIAEQFYPTVLNQLKVAGAPVAATGYRPPQGPPIYQPMISPTYPSIPAPTSRAPVYQSQPAQPRPVYRNYPVPHTVSGAPQPRPTGLSASPVKTAKPQIMIQATVLEVDWKRLAESKLDLTTTIRAFATDPKIRDLRGLGGPDTKFRPVHAVAVPRNTTDGIVRLLVATKAVKILGSPTMVTLAGRPVEFLSGGEIPIVTNREIRNGKEHVKTEFRRFGTALKLIPELVSNEAIKLAVDVDHSRRIMTGGYAVPSIQTRRFSIMVELKGGQSIILSETGPVAPKEKNQTVGKGMMVVLSPSVISATPTAQRTPEKTGVANVVRTVPQPVRLATQPVQPATFIPQPQPQDLHQSVRELRSDVRALRQDVGRLLKLLEKKEKDGQELRPSKASAAEQEIQKALEKKVSLKFEKMPLADIMRVLSQNDNINIDQRGLEEEGLTDNTPVTIDVEGITLKSALKLMLEPLKLTYQIRDEVLFITSKSQTKMTVVTYPVADLVIPIPTAGPVPDNEILPTENKVAANPSTLRIPHIDFDTLTKTILSTIQPDSWNGVGGAASIQPFESTLSLVIRQTPQAHQEITELIAELRRLQDMQVTLESRFLDKLPEDVWKRIDIDFDSKKETNGPLGGILLTDHQTELLLKAAQGDSRANLIQGPKVTLFNGQTADIAEFTVGGKQQPLRHSLHVQPVISADRRNVRLNLRVSDRESPWNKTHAYAETAPNGKTLLIEIGRRDANEVETPLLGKVPYVTRWFMNTGVANPEGRSFLLIRPRVIVQKEEKLLGIELE